MSWPPQLFSARRWPDPGLGASSPMSPVRVVVALREVAAEIWQHRCRVYSALPESNLHKVTNQAHTYTRADKRWLDTHIYIHTHRQATPLGGILIFEHWRINRDTGLCWENNTKIEKTIFQKHQFMNTTWKGEKKQILACLVHTTWLLLVPH